MVWEVNHQRTLVLVRHGKSSWDLDVDDHERPLSARGRRDAEAIGRWLSERSLRPDLVYCSTATRTKQTWEYAMAGGATAGEVQYQREIYHAWVPELLSLIRSVSEDIHSLLVIGHAPGIPDLVEHICVRTTSPDWAQMDSKFPTSALAVVNVPGPWSELGKSRAELAGFVVARG
jgi:phosphohistidine phosphatase